MRSLRSVDRRSSFPVPSRRSVRRIPSRMPIPVPGRSGSRGHQPAQAVLRRGVIKPWNRRDVQWFVSPSHPLPSFVTGVTFRLHRTAFVQTEDHLPSDFPLRVRLRTSSRSVSRVLSAQMMPSRGNVFIVSTAAGVLLTTLAGVWACLMQPRDSVASRNCAVWHWDYYMLSPERCQRNLHHNHQQEIHTRNPPV